MSFKSFIEESGYRANAGRWDYDPQRSRWLMEIPSTEEEMNELIPAVMGMKFTESDLMNAAENLEYIVKILKTAGVATIRKHKK